MSYTNGTTHYNLPLTTGADKRDWSDTNQAFSDVDAALYGAVQDTAQAELDIDALETRMDTAEQNISTNTGNIAGLDTRLTTAEGAITSQGAQITDTRQDLEDMICAYNEASATSTHAYAIGDYFIYNDVLYKATQAIAIGDTIVPDTNCSTTNVTTELLANENLSDDVTQLQSDVTALQTFNNNLFSLVHSNSGSNSIPAAYTEYTRDTYTIPSDGSGLYYLEFESMGTLGATAIVIINKNGSRIAVNSGYADEGATPVSTITIITPLVANDVITFGVSSSDVSSTDTRDWHTSVFKIK